MNTTAILEALEAERDRLTTAIEALQPTARGRGRWASARARKSGRHMSAAARRRISLAQKRRWAERKKKS